MATLAQYTTIKNDDSMIDRVEAAVCKQADYIAETLAQGTAYSQEVVDWAGRVFSSPRSQAIRIMPAIAGNSTIAAAYVASGQAGVSDGDIEYVVGARYSSLARF